MADQEIDDVIVDFAELISCLAVTNKQNTTCDLRISGNGNTEYDAVMTVKIVFDNQIGKPFTEYPEFNEHNFQERFKDLSALLLQDHTNMISKLN